MGRGWTSLQDKMLQTTENSVPPSSIGPQAVPVSPLPASDGGCTARAVAGLGAGHDTMGSPRSTRTEPTDIGRSTNRLRAELRAALCRSAKHHVRHGAIIHDFPVFCTFQVPPTVSLFLRFPPPFRYSTRSVMAGPGPQGKRCKSEATSRAPRPAHSVAPSYPHLLNKEEDADCAARC